MEIGQSVKGTVTSLSSMFSQEEAQGAARYVEEAIAERTKELDRLRSFVDDNSGLVKLVQRLPDQLHHDIMVPFGKGAFFPGRLIHTNEFLVLLGEGYYADRTSKQTVDILNRRGKELDSQVESLKAMIKDLKAEALFFGDTATEAAEGVVEIREEYVKEDPTEEVSLKASTQVDSGAVFENENIKKSAKDEEFARILARMEELEEAELAAESENNNDERLLSGNEVEEAEEDELLTGHSSDTDDDEVMKGNDFDGSEYLESNSIRSQPRSPMNDNSGTAEIKGAVTRPVPRGEILLRKDLAHGGEKNSVSEKVFGVPTANENLPRGRSLGEMTLVESLQPAFDSQKAFTGSIVERSYNLDTKLKNQSGTSSQEEEDCEDLYEDDAYKETGDETDSDWENIKLTDLVGKDRKTSKVVKRKESKVKEICKHQRRKKKTVLNGIKKSFLEDLEKPLEVNQVDEEERGGRIREMMPSALPLWQKGWEWLLKYKTVKIHPCALVTGGLGEKDESLGGLLPPPPWVTGGFG
ncbi:unnamed protein product [Rhodiola kirilowii]